MAILKRFVAEALPFGGAVKLIFQAPQNTLLKVIAKGTNSAPADIDNLATGERLVFEGALEQNEHTYTNASNLAHFYVADLETKKLLDNVAVYYFAYAYNLSTGYETPISTNVTPNCVMNSDYVILRDIIKERLLYHLGRGFNLQLLPSVNERNYVPIEEREALDDGQDLPIILIRERVVPSGRPETIGHLEKESKHPVTGVAKMHTVRLTRNICEMLVITDSPEKRTNLAKYVYSKLHQDLHYYHEYGFEEIAITMSDRSDVEPGHGKILYGSDIQFEAESQIRIERQMNFSLSEDYELAFKVEL